MSQTDIEHAIAVLRRSARWLIYGVLLAFLACLAVGLGNVYYTNSVDMRRRHEAAEQERARAVLAEQTRQLVCSLATAQADALRDAATEAGRKSFAAWQAMATRFDCR